jgi:hypothetical protein
VLRRHLEIWSALAAIVVVTAIYLAAYYWGGAIPAASGFVGHSIGVIGFLLMLATETLYSVRKRLADARWGSMASWLRLHIVMGLVGPYMVLLHTSWKFNGLAGLLTLVTFVVVTSGVVGRYLYTRMPRDETRTDQRTALANWRAAHVPLTWILFAMTLVHVGAALTYATLQR